MKKENKSNLAMELGITAIVATIAGAYYLYGSTKGPARRKAINSWTVKMKGEIMEEIESMKDISEELYNSTIDKISEKYSQIKSIDANELDKIIKELKGHWKNIKKESDKKIKQKKLK